MRQDRKATSGNGAFTASDISVTPTTATVTSRANRDTRNSTRYTVHITPTADGPVTVALTLAEVTDKAGNTVSSTGSTASVTVPYDSTPPTVVVDVPAGPVNGNFDATFDFSEALAADSFELADITLGGTGTATASYLRTDAVNHIYTSRIKPSAEGTIIVGLKLTGVEDAAGNAVTATGSTTSDTLTYDSTPPTVVVDVPAGPVNTAFDATFDFSEALAASGVAAFTAADIHITGTGTATAAAPSLTNAAQHIYTSRITPTADGTITVGLTLPRVKDAADNAVTATGSTTSDTLTYDSTPPTVVVDVPAGPVNGAFDATFNFSEALTTSGADAFTAADIHITGTATAGTPNLTNAANHIYTSRITPTVDGTITVGLTLTGVKDPAGNAVTATGSTTSDTVTYDGTAPTVVVDVPAGPVNGGFDATFDFSEALAASGADAFTAADIHITGTATAGTPNLTNAANHIYTSRITPTVDGTITVGLTLTGVKDPAGNAVTSTGSTTSDTLTYDRTAPTVTVARAHGRTGKINPAFPASFTFNLSHRI